MYFRNTHGTLSSIEWIKVNGNILRLTCFPSVGCVASMATSYNPKNFTGVFTAGDFIIDNENGKGN